MVIITGTDIKNSMILRSNFTYIIIAKIPSLTEKARIQLNMHY